MQDSTTSRPRPAADPPGIYYCTSGSVHDVIAAPDPHAAARELVRRATIERRRLGALVWISTLGYGDPRALPAATVAEALEQLLRPQEVAP